MKQPPKNSNKDQKQVYYYQANNLHNVSIYMSDPVYQTIKRYALADMRSIQKTLQKIVIEYINKRTLDEKGKNKN